MGAKSATVAGLSGLGDIMLTCYGSLSRNRYEMLSSRHLSWQLHCVQQKNIPGAVAPIGDGGGGGVLSSAG